MKRFDEEPHKEHRALQVWLILIGLAHNRQTITYGQLAKLVGFKGAGVFASILGHIMFYCQQNDLPPLTVLVVNQETGLPGKGLIDAELNADRELVFNFNWYGVIPPSPKELAQAHEVGQAALDVDRTTQS